MVPLYRERAQQVVMKEWMFLSGFTTTVKVEMVDMCSFQPKKEIQVKQSSQTHTTATYKVAELNLEFDSPDPSLLSVFLEVRVFSRFCWGKRWLGSI